MAKMKRTRHVVALVEEFQAGERRLVTIGEREIGVFNLNGEYHALLNFCPHRAGPLCHGRTRPLVVENGVYGTVGHEREGEILKCPWHQWEFDIRTGRALYDEALRVRTYDVTVENEEIVLYL